MGVGRKLYINHNRSIIMKEFEDAMLDIAWKNLDSENNRFRDIDTKTIGVITITGILMTFLSIPEDVGSMSMYLFFLTIISFFVTILLSVLAIKVRRADLLVTKYLIEDFKDVEPREHQIRGITTTIAESQYSICKANAKKANNLKYAVITLSIGVVLLISYSFSLVF